MRLLFEGEKSVGDVASLLPVSRPAVSKHLQLLEGVQLVYHKKNGRQNVFSVKQDGLLDAQAWLNGFWDEALPRLALLAENTEDDEVADPIKDTPLS